MINKFGVILRRKFELININSNNEHFIMQFKLTNFINFSKKSFSIKIKDQDVPYEITKLSHNLIEVKINVEHIYNENNIINFYYKKKKLWLVNNEHTNDVLDIKNKIYIIKVNKNLALIQYKTNYNLATKNKPLTILQTDEKHVEINTNEKIESLILLNRHKQLELPILDNKLNLTHIQQTTKEQNYKVYFVCNKKIYQLQSVKSQKAYYLIMKYEWLNNTLYVSKRNLFVTQLNVSSMINETSLNFSTTIEDIDNDYNFESLGILDDDLSTMQYLLTEFYKTRKFAKLKVSSFESVKSKKLIAVFYNKKSRNREFYTLNSKNSVKFVGFYRFEDQLYQINIKNKDELNIVISKPKIKMGVNSITKQTLNFYFQPHVIYEAFQYFITFEERLSQNKYELPIFRGEQDIEIPYDKIEDLKTNSKNIIDIFISIYDGPNLIRKEKIKFKKGIYKKDNYLTLKEKIIDDKRVYYMFTLTPFKNIKIESFELTNEQYQILEHNKKDDNVWLVGERTDTAQDNGIHFFKWLQDNTDIEAYYVIDGKSRDYNRIKNLNNVVIFGSKQHFEVAAKANVLISTHDLENILPYKTARNFWGYENSVRVFLQHGVLGRKKVEYDKENYDLPFHLFNVSSTSEKYDIVVNQLGYDPEDVGITGLPRFDNLPLEPKTKVKKILIMPTWRDWLNSDYAFSNSEYMNRYLELINNKKTEELLEKYNVEINFYPHYRSQEFFKHHLDKAKGKIQYISLGQKTVQELLMEHDILITDYSSVSFDFSYMKKPVIFFHFDVEAFFRKGILRPVEETFIGDIAYSENEVLNKIEKIINKHCVQQNADLSNIFDFVDHKNSERVYYMILNKLKQL